MRVNPHTQLTPQQQQMLQQQQMMQQNPMMQHYQQQQQQMLQQQQMQQQQQQQMMQMAQQQQYQQQAQQMLQMLMAQGYNFTQAQAMVSSQLASPQQAQLGALNSVQGRFGSNSNNTAIPQNTMSVTQPQQQQQELENSGRYSTSNQQPPQFQPVQEQGVVEQQIPEEVYVDNNNGINDFKIEKTTYAFPNSSKGLKVHTDKLDKETVLQTEGLIVSTSVKDTVDALEDFLIKSNETSSKHHIKMSEVILIDESCSVPYKEKVANFFSRGYRKLQREMIKLSKETNDTNDHVWMRKVSELYTNKINEYLAINVEDFIRMEDFVEDISELAYIVSTQYIHLFSDLEHYLDNITDKLYESIKEVNNTEEDKTTKRAISIYHNEIVVYIDTLSYALGIDSITGLNKVMEEENNSFLISLMEVVSGITSEEYFMLVTKDRKFYRFTTNHNKDLIIKQIPNHLV